MRYFATSMVSSVIPFYENGVLGLMNTPASNYKLDRFGDQLVWAADNGCFSSRWNIDAWLEFLETNRHHQHCCQWAVVPDVMGDHQKTLNKFREFAPLVRSLGYKVAFVGQDGADLATTPWDDFDCWFAGGSTDWKLKQSWSIFSEAKRRNKTTHMGRVNSLRRFRIAREAGYDSVDGTYLAFGPDKNLPKLLSWIKDGQQSLPDFKS